MVAENDSEEYGLKQRPGGIYRMPWSPTGGVPSRAAEFNVAMISGAPIRVNLPKQGFPDAMYEVVGQTPDNGDEIYAAYTLKWHSEAQ